MSPGTYQLQLAQITLKAMGTAALSNLWDGVSCMSTIYAVVKTVSPIEPVIRRLSSMYLFCMLLASRMENLDQIVALKA